MEKGIITDSAKIIEQIIRFDAYIHYQDKKTGFISFRDTKGILGREEAYKSSIAEKAREALNCKKWKESWIGTGKIAECAKNAMNRSVNLVNKNQQIDFKNRLTQDHPKYKRDAERALYDLYRNDNCEETTTFSEVVNVFGAKYDTIAYLYFIKDDSRFLPIRSGFFDKGFAQLGIDYKTTGRCSWENYTGFVEIIRYIQDLMKEILDLSGELRLIDAHSFVWIIQQDKYINWTPTTEESVQIESETEKSIQSIVSGPGGRRKTTTNAYVRSAGVISTTKERANGICQLCGQPAPFNDKNGNPYLEVHHIVWLSQGGDDNTDNTAALCPNCHTRMHVLDRQEDIEKLKKSITRSEK